MLVHCFVIPNICIHYIAFHIVLYHKIISCHIIYFMPQQSETSDNNPFYFGRANHIHVHELLCDHIQEKNWKSTFFKIQKLYNARLVLWIIIWNIWCTYIIVRRTSCQNLCTLGLGSITPEGSLSPFNMCINYFFGHMMLYVECQTLAIQIH